MAKSEHARKRGLLQRLHKPVQESCLFVVVLPLVGTLAILVGMSAPRWVLITLGGILATVGLFVLTDCLVKVFQKSAFAHILHDFAGACMVALFSASMVRILLFGTGDIEVHGFIPAPIAIWVLRITFIPLMTVTSLWMFVATPLRWYRWFRYKEWDWYDPD